MSDIKVSYNWYPVYTNPRAEKRANELLIKKGIETYLPLKKTLKQWSDRKKWVEEPLIKSYLFVKISAQQQAEVLMTNGISRFVYFSGKFASIPDKQIDALRALWDSGIEMELAEYSFKKGESVSIKNGPLKGLTGELISESTGKKFILKIDQIKQAIKVQIPSQWLEPLQQQS